MPDARPPPPLAPAVLLPLLPGYGVLCTEDVCAEKQKYHCQSCCGWLDRQVGQGGISKLESGSMGSCRLDRVRVSIDLIASLQSRHTAPALRRTLRTQLTKWPFGIVPGSLLSMAVAVMTTQCSVRHLPLSGPGSQASSLNQGVGHAQPCLQGYLKKRK